MDLRTGCRYIARHCQETPAAKTQASECILVVRKSNDYKHTHVYTPKITIATLIIFSCISDQVVPIRESYTYKFIPFTLGRTAIHRELDDGTMLAPFSTHFPPYHQFPELQHSCHPYFAIYAAIQVYEAQEDLTDEQLQTYATLRLVHSLWEDLNEFRLDDNVLPPLLKKSIEPPLPSPNPASK